MNEQAETADHEPDGASPEGRRKLLANGYEPIPICGKGPRWRWRQGAITDELMGEIEADPRYSDHQNTGLRTGHLSVVDVDVREEEHVERIVKAITDVLGETDLQRVGSKGVALCYYNPEPITKISIIGKKAGASTDSMLVEFLGTGQQVAAYGIHPDTGKPYDWTYSFDDGEPLYRRLVELPAVSPDKIMEAAKSAAVALTALGYLDVTVSGVHDSECVPSVRRGEPVSLSWLTSALKSIPPTVKREEWIRVLWSPKEAILVPDLNDDELIELLDRWSSGELTGEPVASYRGYQDVELNYYWAKGKTDRPVGIGTLFEIAKRYGFQGGPPGVSLMDLANDNDVNSTQPLAAAPTQTTTNRWPNLTRRGAQILDTRPAAMVIPGYLRDVGYTIILAQRGTGKTVVATGVGLSLAADRRWLGEEVAPGFYVVYLCGEDQENTAAHIAAWCNRYNGGRVPDRFIYIEDVPDLMCEEDCRALAKHLRSIIPVGSRAVMITDTWQRATSAAKDGQNSDRDMAAASENLERLAAEFGGPAIGCFHPPKHDRGTTHGSSVTENASTGIWQLAVDEAGLKLEVTRIKGRGLGNYKRLRIEEASLNRKDAFGCDMTGALAIHIGGTVTSTLDKEEKENAEREIVLAVALEFIDKGIGLVRGNGSGQKPKDIARVLLKRYNIQIDKVRVLDYLNEFERQGRLTYVVADRNKRIKAGFQRPSVN